MYRATVSRHETDGAGNRVSSRAPRLALVRTPHVLGTHAFFHLGADVADAWKRLAGVDLLDGYGQTETLMTVLTTEVDPIGWTGMAIQ